MANEKQNKAMILLKLINPPANIKEINYIITNINKTNNNKILGKFNEDIKNFTTIELLESGEYYYGITTNERLGYFIITEEDIADNRNFILNLNFNKEKIINSNLNQKKYSIEPIQGYDNYNEKDIYILPKTLASSVKTYEDKNIQDKIDYLKRVILQSKSILKDIEQHNKDVNAHSELVKQIDKLNLIQQHNENTDFNNNNLDLRPHPYILDKINEIKEFINNYKNTYEYYRKLPNTKTTFIKDPATGIETVKIFYPKTASSPVVTSVKNNSIIDEQGNTIYITNLTIKENKIQIQDIKTPEEQLLQKIIQL